MAKSRGAHTRCTLEQMQARLILAVCCEGVFPFTKAGDLVAPWIMEKTRQGERVICGRCRRFYGYMQTHKKRHKRPGRRTNRD